MARQPLGRGLNALLGEASAPTAENKTTEIDIDLIDPNPDQPRSRFADDTLEELAQSIRSNGIVQPIVVRQIGTRYQIVAGERRWRAAQKAELRRVPVAVREVSDEKLLELALIENIQRQELNPIEEASAYRKLIDNIGLTQEAVAERVGRSRTSITTAMRLLKLPATVQKDLENGMLSAGHGRALLLTDDPIIQRSVADEIIEKGLSVREVERAIKADRNVPRPGTKGNETAADPNIKAAEVRLMRELKTNVKIRPNGKGSAGKIEIEYYNLDDLDRIYRQIIAGQN
ncbi:MAG: ParB/RepB/Spo0J family partition protein [Acidobacteriota bacterium]|nr:MAG: ParB/RepB/Spo0J family partition protein [Acidobacteriota bacterium]